MAFGFIGKIVGGAAKIIKGGPLVGDQLDNIAERIAASGFAIFCLLFGIALIRCSG